MRRNQLAVVDKVALTFCFVLFSVSANARADDAAAERTWSDDTGRFQIKATFQSSDGTSVTLKKVDGGLITVPLARLSEADRKHLESLLAKNPFVPTVQPPKAGSEAIVLVHILGANNTETTVAGVVFHRDGKWAYVLTNQQRPVENSIRSPVAETTIICESANGQRRVSGEVISLYNRSDGQPVEFNDSNISCIVAAPQEQMPTPIDVETNFNLAEGAVVGIAGFQTDTSQQSPSFARVTTSATVVNIFRAASVAATTWELESPELTKVQYGVGFLANGKAVGNLSVSGHSGQTRAVLMGSAVFNYVQQPRLLKVDMQPISGDAKTIRYSFLLSVFDPFNRFQSPKFRVTPRAGRIGGGVGGIATVPSKDSVVLDLTPGTDNDELVTRFGAERRISPGVKLLVAHYDAENLGPNQQITFELSLTCNGPRGETINLITGTTPMVVSYTGLSAPTLAAEGAGSARRGIDSKIPGLDGKPLDLPRPVKLESGGWLITSDLTRVKDQPKRGSGSFPVSAAGKGDAVAGKPETNGPLTWRDLRVPANPKGFGATGRPQMIYAPDGKWLYVIDGRQTLHKIDPQTLVEDGLLEMQADTNGMAFTSEGLIVNVSSIGALWIVDPESLEVKREIGIGDVTLLAGSPATPIGFAIVTPPGEIPQLRFPQLLMIDFKAGKALHTIKGAYGSRGRGGSAIMVEDKPIFENQPEPAGMVQTPDGKALFLSAARLVKFRLDGTDLIFEQSTSEPRRAYGSPIALSSDGKRIAAAAELRPGSTKGAIQLFSVNDLSAPVLTLSTQASVTVLGIDSKTGNFYAPVFAPNAESGRNRKRSDSNAALDVFGPRGGKIHTATFPEKQPRAIAVNPNGEQFTAWCEQRIVVGTVGPLEDAAKE